MGFTLKAAPTNEINPWKNKSRLGDFWCHNYFTIWQTSSKNNNMADITMCTTKDCPFASTCYRKTATVNSPHQSYQAFPLSRLLSGSYYCEFYQNNEVPFQVEDSTLISASKDFSDAVKKQRES